MPVITSGLPLLDGASLPANGRIAGEVTARISTVTGIITRTPFLGVIKDGVIFGPDGVSALTLAATPTGEAVHIWELLEGKNHNGSTVVRPYARVVQIPDVASVAYSDLIDVESMPTGGWVIPPYIQTLIDQVEADAAQVALDRIAVAADRAAVELIPGQVDTAMAAQVGTGGVFDTALDATIAADAAPISAMTPEAHMLTGSIHFNPPFYSSVLLDRPDLGNAVVVGTNATFGVMTVDSVQGKVFSYQFTALAGAGSAPPTGAFLNDNNSGKMAINRFGNEYYGVFAMPNNQWSVFRAPTAEPYVWTKVLDLTTDGTSTGVGTSIGTGMDSGNGYLFVSEYGDPTAGGVDSPSLWRTQDGFAWTKLYTGTFRHIHAVACDPFNLGHVYMTSGDGSAAAKLLKSIDNGTTWTTIYTGDALFQAVQISFSTNFIWLAADADGISALVVDRATGIPKFAAKNSHMNIAVPGGAPGDMFHSQAYFGAFDSVTSRYYFITAIAGITGNRHGLFYIDKPGGTTHLLTPLPDRFIPQRVIFITEDSRRILYAGNLRAEITDHFAPEGVA
ncbi:WD40/YVTN/BNR-like repeat-containing protein [Cryobacterium psychrophilum]|uniref:Uncharacterized protein n=1 Tax=Cryobacterium psychrophilum TaxID=41988 RepID=A0A4Y8KUS2_9MICO|nr:hypothetical protein [Cryobacterium psychrophilum]TDW31032.1 hypothetical protein EDD25_2820 [Cryobacterium psychrophilum]TFD80885.1 hypothetical protein E3T53_04495 [Cryobacterium psychrophilum]